MIRPTDYRRFGADSTGTRPALRLGDPGIDAGWLRRYRWGAMGGAAWLVLLPVLLAVGFLSAWGPFGRIDSWQLDTFGSGSVILLVILFMPLAFVPLAAAHLLPVDASTPALLGIRQSFDTRWGPRVVGRPGDARARLRRLSRLAQGSAVVGAVTLAVFAGKGIHDADTPHPPLPRVGMASLADSGQPLPYAVRLTDAVADRSRTWEHRYRIRQDSHRDVYYPLRPAASAAGGATGGPAAIVELDQTNPQYEAARWNMVDPPGPREGVPELLDDWTAGELRRAGIALAPRVVVLRRQRLDGHDPRPDPLDDFVFALFGFAALFCGLVFWWAMARAARQLPENSDG